MFLEKRKLQFITYSFIPYFMYEFQVMPASKILLPFLAVAFPLSESQVKGPDIIV